MKDVEFLINLWSSAKNTIGPISSVQYMRFNTTKQT